MNKNLFQNKKVHFFCILPYLDRNYQKLNNSWCDFYCQFQYYIIKDTNNHIITLTEIFENQKCLEDFSEIQKIIFSKINRLEGLFNNNKRILNQSIFYQLECIGIFYDNKLIAITNDECKKFIDPLLNEIKDVEEFKKAFGKK